MAARTDGTGILRNLLEARELSGLSRLHLASQASPVQAVALIGDIEEISTIGPDTVVVLSPEVARGGWMILAALRYSWERRSCALVVPTGTFTDTAVELARRLGLSLLAAEGDMTRVAIDIAVQIGVLRAGSLARIQAFSERIAQFTRLQEILDALSSELDASSVSLEAQESVTVQTSAPHGKPGEAYRTQTASRQEPAPLRVEAEVFPEGRDVIAAWVAPLNIRYAEQILTAALPSVRAVLAKQRLQSLRSALPPLSLASLSGLQTVPGFDPPSLTAADERLGWPISGGITAICILTAERDRVGAAVLQLWSESFGDSPLMDFTDGWAGIIPTPDRAARSHAIESLRSRRDRLGTEAVQIGVSRLHSEADEFSSALRESWLAARMDHPESPDSPTVLIFDEVTARIPGRAFPRDLARQLAGELFPEFVADAAHEELARSVIEYLDHHGSIRAASNALRVHRNTLQARLRRAEQLGIPLQDARATLSTHLLLNALARASPSP